VSPPGDETDGARISAHRAGFRPAPDIRPAADPRPAPAPLDRHDPDRSIRVGRRRPGAHFRAHGPGGTVVGTIVTTRTTGSGGPRKPAVRRREAPIRGCRRAAPPHRPLGRGLPAGAGAGVNTSAERPGRRAGKSGPPGADGEKAGVSGSGRWRSASSLKETIRSRWLRGRNVYLHQTFTFISCR
jgi:hypothetical protein